MPSSSSLIPCSLSAFCPFCCWVGVSISCRWFNCTIAIGWSVIFRCPSPSSSFNHRGVLYHFSWVNDIFFVCKGTNRFAPGLPAASCSFPSFSYFSTFKPMRFFEFSPSCFAPHNIWHIFTSLHIVFKAQSCLLLALGPYKHLPLFLDTCRSLTVFTKSKK